MSSLFHNEELVEEISTALGLYQVVDMIYDGRRARVLFSGDRLAAQSGLARDGKPELLFDYNQRFVELVLSARPKRLLLIGGGALTLPMALRAVLPELDITVVELNPDLPGIAEQYFGYEPHKRTHIITNEGRRFLEETDELYDVILLDAFSNAAMPRQLMTAEAAALYARHLLPHGLVASNIIASYYGQKAAGLYRLWSALASACEGGVELFPASRSLLSFWLPQNFVIVGYKSDRPVLELRYGALDPLPAGDEHLIHDNY